MSTIIKISILVVILIVFGVLIYFYLNTNVPEKTTEESTYTQDFQTPQQISQKSLNKPVDCQMSEWSFWSKCDSSTGKQTRERSIIVQPLNGGSPCDILIEQKDCSVDCEVNEWSNYSDCKISTDGKYYKTRTRTIKTQPVKGGMSCPILTETIQCQPINCAVSNWSYSDCKLNTDGKYYKNRTRTIVNQPLYGGESCPVLSDTVQCERIDCAVTDWSDYSDCKISTDGKYYKSRTRTVLSQPAYGGDSCPILSEKTQCLPISCEVSDWSDYSECKLRPDGSYSKSRFKDIIVNPQYGGASCPSNLLEFENCKLNAVCASNKDNVITNYNISNTPLSGTTLAGQLNQKIFISPQYIKNNKEKFALSPSVVINLNNIDRTKNYYKATLKPGVTTFINPSKNITPQVTSCSYQFPTEIYVPVPDINSLIFQQINSPTDFSTILTNASTTNTGFVISSQVRTLPSTIPPTLPISTTVWIKLNSVATGVPSGVIFGNYGSANPINWMIDLNYKPRIVWISTNGITDVTFPNSLSPNVWYYLTFIKLNDTTVQLYINGVLNSTVTTPTTNGSVSNLNFYIGRDARPLTTDIMFKGSMYNLEIYSNPLNINDILNSYQTELNILKSLTSPSLSTDLTSAVIKGAY
jgi:hypothetical protein